MVVMMRNGKVIIIHRAMRLLFVEIDSFKDIDRPFDGYTGIEPGIQIYEKFKSRLNSHTTSPKNREANRYIHVSDNDKPKFDYEHTDREKRSDR
jgi:hypothetical protein